MRHGRRCHFDVPFLAMMHDAACKHAGSPLKYTRGALGDDFPDFIQILRCPASSRCCNSR